MVPGCVFSQLAVFVLFCNCISLRVDVPKVEEDNASPLPLFGRLLLACQKWEPWRYTPLKKKSSSVHAWTAGIALDAIATFASPPRGFRPRNGSKGNEPHFARTATINMDAVTSAERCHGLRLSRGVESLLTSTQHLHGSVVAKPLWWRTLHLALTFGADSGLAVEVFTVD